MLRWSGIWEENGGRRKDDKSNHLCCCYRAGQRRSCTRERGRWRGIQQGWWRTVEKTSAPPSMPFLLKCFTQYCWLLWISKLVTFNASLRMTLCLLNSLQILLSSVSIVVLSAAVALLSQPSGTPVPLHQSERATVAKSSLIGRRWLNLLSCGSDESSPRKQGLMSGGSWWFDHNKIKRGREHDISSMNH